MTQKDTFACLKRILLGTDSAELKYNIQFSNSIIGV